MPAHLIVRHALADPASTFQAHPHPRSACRAVWYCSTECAKANWRQGGHREACAVLRAARREERAQGEQEQRWRQQEQQQQEQGEQEQQQQEQGEQEQGEQEQQQQEQQQQEQRGEEGEQGQDG